jgi:hypothetical protein
VVADVPIFVVAPPATVPLSVTLANENEHDAPETEYDAVPLPLAIDTVLRRYTVDLQCASITQSKTTTHAYTTDEAVTSRPGYTVII